MKFNEVVYSVTLADVIVRFAQQHPGFVKSFMEGTSPFGSIDLDLPPASMNFKRADIQEAIATLRVMGKL